MVDDFLDIFDIVLRDSGSRRIGKDWLVSDKYCCSSKGCRRLVVGLPAPKALLKNFSVEDVDEVVKSSEFAQPCFALHWVWRP